MRGYFILAIIAIALLWGGGQGLYTALTNRHVKEYTVERYLQDKPSTKWLRLTGGVADLTGMNYSSFLGVGAISEIYVPVRPVGSSSDEPVHILFATKDPALLQLAEKLRAVRTDDEMRRFLQDDRNAPIIARDVQGLIRFGIELKDRDERKLRRLNPNLSDDFVVLADGERPEYVLHTAMFLGGTMLAAWFLARIFFKTSQPSIPQPPVIPSGPNSPPPLPKHAA